MVHIMTLWLPILLSAVLVFVASFIIHMVLGYHKNDFKKLPAQDDMMDALRKFNIPPGDYMMPRPDSMKEMKEPAFQEKWSKGPRATLTVMKGGPPSMGLQLVQWFVYCLIVGVFSAYVSGRALAQGAGHLPVLRFAGTAAFLGYSLALMQNSIWYKRSWGTTLRTMFDGLVFACLTGATFSWFWPR